MCDQLDSLEICALKYEYSSEGMFGSVCGMSLEASCCWCWHSLLFLSWCLHWAVPN